METKVTQNPSKIVLLVGLANPGADYANTRHNVGAWWIDALATQQAFALKSESKLQTALGEFLFQQNKIRCSIPQTFMNESGQAVQKIQRFYKLPTDSIMVVHDDLDLPPGVIRFKQGGGNGGHNGLKNISQHLGSPNYHRLRLGIGHPGDKNKVHRYVLSPPNQSDKKKITAAIDESISVLPSILEGRLQDAMQQLHSFSA